MPPVMSRLSGLVAGAALALAGAPVAAAVNIVPAHTIDVDVFGIDGVLRVGSPWVPGSTPSDPLSPVDGSFEPENQQWNNGSFWWDEDPSINAAGPLSW